MTNRAQGARWETKYICVSGCLENIFYEPHRKSVEEKQPDRNVLFMLNRLRHNFWPLRRGKIVTAEIYDKLSVCIKRSPNFSKLSRWASWHLLIPNWKEKEEKEEKEDKTKKEKRRKMRKGCSNRRSGRKRKNQDVQRDEIWRKLKGRRNVRGGRRNRRTI